MGRGGETRGSGIIRKFAVIVTFLFSAQFTAPQGFTQTEQPVETQGEASGAQVPIPVEQPAYEYYYWPEEDLNNFGLSTMGDGKSGSTLGQDTKRRSNLEVNAPLKSKKRKGENADNLAETEDGQESNEPLYTEPLNEPRAHEPSGKAMYEWQDEDGTIHITNNLGSVPLEYQKDFFESQDPDTGQ